MKMMRALECASFRFTSPLPLDLRSLLHEVARVLLACFAGEFGVATSPLRDTPVDSSDIDFVFFVTVVVFVDHGLEPLDLSPLAILPHLQNISVVGTAFVDLVGAETQ